MEISRATQVLGCRRTQDPAAPPTFLAAEPTLGEQRSMPDPMLLLTAGAVSALLSTALTLLLGRPTAAPRPVQIEIGSVLGVVLGFYLGCWILGITIGWPLPSRERAQDLDRLLLVVIPAVALSELLAAVPGKFRFVAWLIRLLIVLGTVRVMLDGSVYITDVAGPGTREWTAGDAMWVFVGSATALAAAWGSLGKLSLRSRARSLPLVLVASCVGAALCVMLSGYARGGQIGIPLAGAIVGASIASLVLKNPVAPAGVIGIGTVGLFAILVVGRFYGSLGTLNAVLLFFGPVCCWLLEVPPRFIGVARLGLVSCLVLIAVVFAGRKFVEDSAAMSNSATRVPAASGPREVTAEDYLNYGT